MRSNEFFGSSLHNYKNTKGWLRQFVRGNLILDRQPILLDNREHSILVNYIIMIRKHEMCKAQLKQMPHRTGFLKITLKRYMIIENFTMWLLLVNSLWGNGVLF